jgi:hypothetical protein
MADKLKKAQDEEEEGGGMDNPDEQMAAEEDSEKGCGAKKSACGTAEKGCGTAEKGCKKSDELTEDDLQKSLDQLSALTEDKTISRKQQLLTKAQGSELSKSEQNELFELLGKSEQTKQSLSGEVTKGLGNNDTLQKALDVSDFLQEQHSELIKSLGVLAEALEKSDSRQHEFNLVLARAVSGIGQLTKSLGERVGVIEAQPARGPKSRGVAGAQPLEKSFVGANAQGTQLSKAAVLDELENMVQESMQKSLGGMTEDGFDLVTASSKYEQFNLISQGLLDQVQKRIQERKVAAR